MGYEKGCAQRRMPLSTMICQGMSSANGRHTLLFDMTYTNCYALLMIWEIIIYALYKKLKRKIGVQAYQARYYGVSGVPNGEHSAVPVRMSRPLYVVRYAYRDG